VVLVGRPDVARGQDVRAAARDVVKQWQDAIVNVRVVLKTRMSMGGREMQSADDSVDAVGTVIDPSGLTVMSLVGLAGTALASALGDRLGPVTLLNVQGLGLVAGGAFVIVALRPAVSGVTPATERTLMVVGRTG